MRRRRITWPTSNCLFRCSPRAGVLVADNLLSHADDLAAFRERALGDERLSGLVVPIGRGELFAVRVA